MQRARILASILGSIVFLAIGGALLWAGQADGQSREEIIRYYWDRAKARFSQHQPDSAGLSYSLRVQTYYRHVNRKGKVTSTDTTLAEYYFSWGQLDSIKPIGPSRVDQDRINLSYPNIFTHDYHLTSFPNDTGGIDLAIGFDSDSTALTDPTGLAIIDRNTYLLRWLYLYYPNMPGYKRYTRSLRFTPHDGFVFPDSIWEVGSFDGIFTSEFYRVESGIEEVTIYR